MLLGQFCNQTCGITRSQCSVCLSHSSLFSRPGVGHWGQSAVCDAEGGGVGSSFGMVMGCWPLGRWFKRSSVGVCVHPSPLPNFKVGDQLNASSTPIRLPPRPLTVIPWVSRSPEHMQACGYDSVEMFYITYWRVDVLSCILGGGRHRLAWGSKLAQYE